MIIFIKTSPTECRFFCMPFSSVTSEKGGTLVRWETSYPHISSAVHRYKSVGHLCQPSSPFSGFNVCNTCSSWNCGWGGMALVFNFLPFLGVWECPDLKRS
jgi:hypothetical protein